MQNSLDGLKRKYFKTTYISIDSFIRNCVVKFQKFEIKRRIFYECTINTLYVYTYVCTYLPTYTLNYDRLRKTDLVLIHTDADNRKRNVLSSKHKIAD